MSVVWQPSVTSLAKISRAVIHRHRRLHRDLSGVGTWRCVAARWHAAEVGAQDRRLVDYLIVGTAFIFSGAALILWANAGSYFVLSNVASTVYADVGAAISAIGCIASACTVFVVHAASRRGLYSAESRRQTRAGIHRPAA